jgi:hypothetical protein
VFENGRPIFSARWPASGVSKVAHYAIVGAARRMSRIGAGLGPRDKVLATMQ